MATNLRDLEADRRYVEICRRSEDRDPPESVRYFSAGDVEELIDEIERLKRLLVSEQDGWFYVCLPFTCKPDDDCEPWCNEKGFIGWRFRNANHAWAAVRKAAMKTTGL